ncbi:MAG: GIY-YIG nuclease family protein [Deltaproteobacteria bacterium]|nr:GIY-YIG nuclease family protein [Deltaproteobacteria bacterium]
MYVYIIKSLVKANRHYVGITDDPKRRLQEHNAGESTSTWKYRPWKMVWFGWFRNAKAAHNFEEYLKSGSGRTFSKRHFY